MCFAGFLSTEDTDVTVQESPVDQAALRDYQRSRGFDVPMGVLEAEREIEREYRDKHGYEELESLGLSR